MLRKHVVVRSVALLTLVGVSLLLAVAIVGSASADTTPAPLTANLAAPADHDGNPFAVLLQFSKPIDNKNRHVKQAFSVTGGSITKAKRLNPKWRSGKKVASQWELTVTPSGGGDVVLAAPGGRSCSAGSALCTLARQSLSHDLSATIRDGTAEAQEVQSGSDLPKPVKDLSAGLHSGSTYQVSWVGGSDRSGRIASEYRILVGGCDSNRRIPVPANSSGSQSYTRMVSAGTTAAGKDPSTAAFGVEGINRNGTGPCVSVLTQDDRPGPCPVDAPC